MTPADAQLFAGSLIHTRDADPTIAATNPTAAQTITTDAPVILIGAALTAVREVDSLFPGASKKLPTKKSNSRSHPGATVYFTL